MVMPENSMRSGVTLRGGGDGSALARIDQYELVRELGGGGFGTVYLAKDTVSGVQYAVKGFPPFVKNNREELENIKANFALVSRLSHTNIARAHVLHLAKEVEYNSEDVHQKLRVDPGDTLMVMEYAPGATLSQWCRQFPDRKVPLDKALEIVRQIASALDYAHGQKILHRDVKPANVMIETGADGKLVARVLDFGLAAEIRSSMGRVSREIHDTSGTRPYMAPEQWLGERQSPATDQYALAVLFHELVTGEVPFSSVFDTGDPVVMMNVVGREPAKLSESLPPCVRAALAKALAKKPEERFANCAEFIAALEGKVSCGGMQGKGGVSKVIVILAFLAALAGGGYYGWMRYDESVKAKEKAQAEERARWEKANEERISKLKAEKERYEAEKQKIEAERLKREKEQAEERARQEKLNEERIAKLKARAEQLEAEKRKIEAEQKKRDKELEEERARIAKPRDEPVKPAAATELTFAEQEARQKEVARLSELRVDIGIKCEDATEKMKRIAAYRGEPDGFKAHIDNADAKFRLIETAERNPATVADAEASLKSVTEAENAIAKELHWLNTNKTARDGAKAVEAEIVRVVDPELKRFKADDYARVVFGVGDRLRKEGNVALAQGDFPLAKKKLDEAKAKLSEAAANARKFCIDTHLNTARKWGAASRWQQCAEECDKVLGWDATNAEAKKLKEEAEGHLVPTARVVATVDGREVSGAKLSDGKNTFDLPVSWTLEDGKKYGPYEISYESDGKRYFGNFDEVTVDWKGTRPFSIALKEHIGPKAGDTKTLTLPGDVKMEMIYVAPGSFTMGSPSSEDGRYANETQHLVTLTKGYWLGKYEVTQRQWESVMGDNSSSFKGENKPVENVSWEDCQEFCRKVNDAAIQQFGGGARLPTEAEWEYACRAGTTTAYSWGNTLNGDKANCDGNYPYGTTVKGRYRQATSDVGSYSPNAWGFHDMHGNVYEWCNDWYNSRYDGDATDPIGPASGGYRVLRGGGWINLARCCRSANRLKFHPGYRNSYCGFRLAASTETRDEAEIEDKREEEAEPGGRVTETPHELPPTYVISQNGHKGVQLWEGGPYWAETNIGAEKPEDYGYYFWWGDTVGCKRKGEAFVASNGSTSNFSFYSVSTPTYGKDIDTLKGGGWVTMNGVLTPEHDAAHMYWGGKWRMPTNQELIDLAGKCEWAWTTMNGVNGYVVRGKGTYSPHSIFLPAAGNGRGTLLYGAGSFGFYWSSVPDSGNSLAWDLYFHSSCHFTFDNCRDYGHSVRPVQGGAK